MTGVQPISTGRMQAPLDPAGPGVSDPPPGDVPGELARLVMEVRQAALNPAPAMIHCDMGVGRIDFLLRSAPPARLEALFGPEADTAWKVRYGLCSPEQLHYWIVDRRLSVDELATAAARRRVRDAE